VQSNLTVLTTPEGPKTALALRSHGRMEKAALDRLEALLPGQVIRVQATELYILIPLDGVVGRKYKRPPDTPLPPLEEI
jgi:hypothetical protein